MATRVTLNEFESRPIELDFRTARELLSAAGGHLTLTPLGAANEYLLTASHFVGAVVLPEIEVLVRPKIRLDNLFLLLEVGLPADAWSKDLVDLASDRGLLPALAAFFARNLDTALARGVLRSYRSEQDRLPALRGRLNFPILVRQPAVLVPIPCQFDEYTADIDENRYVKSAARRLLRVAGVQPEIRRRLLDQVMQLEEVSDIAPDPALADRLTFTRLNSHYAPAIRLARLILEQLTLVDQLGHNGAHAFFLNMNDLFQSFVTERLRRELSRTLEVEGEPVVYLGRGRRVEMLPDLVFRADGQRVYVGDAKYKITGTGHGQSSDYYQLLAYTSALNLREGVLVYCQSDGEAPPRLVEAKYTGKRLFTYAIDLRGSSDDVEKAMADLADWVSTRIMASVASPAIA